MSKITITAEQAVHNMGTLQALLLATSPSQKATDFANRVFAQINARSADWLAANAAELQIFDAYSGVAEDRRSPAPVADNRPYFIGKLQMALLNA